MSDDCCNSELLTGSDAAPQAQDPRTETGGEGAKLSVWP
jgi:hypothetical protein